MMESLDSGTASRSPTPDSGNSTNSSSSGLGSQTSSSSKVTTVTTSTSKGDNNLNSTSNTPPVNNNNNKTSRDYNNRHSSGHGQYKKYGNHQNHHYGYGGHNVHYQRYNNGNGHRNYGNKHYHNSSNYHHNNHNHYQNQNYHHNQYSQQNHHSHSTSNSNSSTDVVNSGSNSNAATSLPNNSRHHHQYHSNHHNGNNLHHVNQQTQYYNSHSSTGSVPPPHHQHHHNNPHHHNNSHHPHHQHHHRNNAPPLQPPQVYVSSDTPAADTFTWASRRGGGDTAGNNTNWSSPNLNDAVGGGETASLSTTSGVQISLSLSALQGIYSPSPQNASPASSPATTDSSDAYSLQEDGGSTTGNTLSSSTTNGIPANNSVRLNNNNNQNISNCIDTTTMHFTSPGGGAVVLETTSSSLNGGTTSSSGPSPVNNMANGFSYATQFHPGFYTYPGAGHHNPLGGGRTLSHPHHHYHHPQIISQNLSLLIPADSSFSMGKADSSISSSSSDKTLEWPDDGTLLTTCSSAASGDRADDYGSYSLPTSIADNWCAPQEYYYPSYTITTTAPAPFTAANKKRLYNGNGPPTGKLSQAVRNQRFHQYPRKMAYHLPGFPREWFDDLDPDEYVRAFSKFGEVTERPAALSQNPQSDSLSEGIWLKFVANQQTTDTFRKKMELWRDVYRIVRSLNYNSHFKHDVICHSHHLIQPRNFPSFGLQVVGSTMSGFGSNTSDVDMCLLVRGSDVDQRYEAVDKLQVLYGALSGTQWLDNVELIYAKVPILKFRDPKRSLEVDLNCNNFVGIRNTHLLYCYSQADWRLKPLVLVVKLWAHQHGINDAKNMTISSYSLVLMVIHFLQCGMDEPVLPILQNSYPEKFGNTSNILNVKINEVLPTWTSKNKESIGNLLIQFLEYYANKFDYSENAASVRTGRTIPIKHAAAFKSLKNDPHQWKFLCIEEPFDRTNTARSVYDRDTFDKIIGIFKYSFERLQASRNLESIFTPISESDIRASSSSVVIR